MNAVYIAILIGIVTLLLDKLNKLLFKGILKRRNKLHLKFMRSVVSVAIYIAGVYGIFAQFEITKGTTGSIVTSSSIIVAVVIFAAQESLNDILSGVMLSWSRPFEIGERVQIASLNLTGIVEDITVRHTIIRTFNHSKIIIPNSVLNKQVIENSSNTNSRVGNFLDVTISYESDLEKAIAILEELVAAHDKVLITEETPVKVSVRNLTDNGIDLRIQVWTTEVNDNFLACSDLRKSVLERFKESGIGIPYKTISIVSPCEIPGI